HGGDELVGGQLVHPAADAPELVGQGVGAVEQLVDPGVAAALDDGLEVPRDVARGFDRRVGRLRHQWSIRARMPDMDGDVRALLDEQAIRRVLARYCRGIDRLDQDLVRSCYHPDATEAHGTFTGGLEEYLAWVWKLLGRYA